MSNLDKLTFILSGLLKETNKAINSSINNTETPYHSIKNYKDINDTINNQQDSLLRFIDDDSRRKFTTASRNDF